MHKSMLYFGVAVSFFMALTAWFITDKPEPKPLAGLDSDAIAVTHPVAKFAHTSSTKFGISETIPVQENAISLLWPEYSELNAQESVRFNIVMQDIKDYLHWGKVQDDRIDEFRQIIFELGDRGIATIGRQLAELNADSIPNDQAAESVVEQLDLLSYFADAEKFQLANQIVEQLATREIAWHDELATVVSLEAFDIYAKHSPHEAAQFIENLTPNSREAYVVHYAYGRKLAGIPIETLQDEIMERFDFNLEEILAKQAVQPVTI